jgi:hypothetical protein
MSAVKDGGAAFPGPSFTQSGLTNGHAMGMTLRDWFAGQAPVDFDIARQAAGLGNTISAAERETVWRAMSTLRYEYADAMIAARGEP